MPAGDRRRLLSGRCRGGTTAGMLPSSSRPTRRACLGSAGWKRRYAKHIRALERYSAQDDPGAAAAMRLPTTAAGCRSRQSGTMRTEQIVHADKQPARRAHNQYGDPLAQASPPLTWWSPEADVVYPHPTGWRQLLRRGDPRIAFAAGAPGLETLLFICQEASKSARAGASACNLNPTTWRAARDHGHPKAIPLGGIPAF